MHADIIKAAGLAIVEAIVRGHLWLLISYRQSSFLVACAGSPEGLEKLGWHTLSGGVVGGLFFLPAFILFVLPLRFVIPDPAARAFIAWALFTLAGSMVGAWYDLESNDVCSDQYWEPVMWLGVAASAGASAVLAHWLVVRGLGSLIGGRDRLLGVKRS